MMISKVNVEHQKEIQQMNEEFDTKLMQYIHDEAEYKETIKKLKSEALEITQELERVNEIKTKLEEEVAENKKTHEEEVSMRLRFESKLNQLHSLYRDIETRYARALEDIDVFEQKSKELFKLTDAQRAEISNLSREKLDLETEKEFNKNQIKNYLREGETKQRKINDLEIRINEYIIQNEKLHHDVISLKDMITQKEIELDSDKTVITGLKYERTQLETALRENQKEKDNYCNMFENQRVEFEKIRDELQSLQRKEMAFDKLRSNFEERVKQMYDENLAVQKKLDKVEKEAETFKQKNEILETRNETLNKNYTEVSTEILEINSLKNEFKKHLDDANQTITFLKSQVSDRVNESKKDK